MQKAWPLHSDHLFLQQHIAQHPTQPFSRSVSPTQRHPLFINGDSPKKSFDQCINGTNGKQIHGDQSPHTMTDIPINLTGKFHKCLQFLSLWKKQLPLFINDAYVKVKNIYLNSCPTGNYSTPIRHKPFFN